MDPGKAGGSGKSTLVKYIVDNDKTKDLLSAWRPEAKILSYFFWKIGSAPQNSLKGLLCTLLYKALEENPHATTHLLDTNGDFSAKTSYHDWSVQDLKTALFMILGQETTHFCIFIDGLDEISNKDGFSKLKRLIEDINRFQNVKICVSSRPETLIVGWLEGKGVHGIQLEDLTLADMKGFVRKELEPFVLDGTITETVYDSLCRNLVRKAQGVFLWLFLSTQSLVTGIQYGDGERELLLRIEQLPSELEQLYAEMWQRFNENHSIHRETAARYFHLALEKELKLGVITSPYSGPRPLYALQPNLAQIAFAESSETEETRLLSESKIRDPEVQRLCDATLKDIQRRCAGLLCVKESNLYFGQPIDRMFSRIIFIHRTAHDFLVDTAIGHDILKHDASSTFEIKVKMLKGWLCCLRFLGLRWEIVETMRMVVDQVSYLACSASSVRSRQVLKVLHVLQWMYDRQVILGDDHERGPPVPFLSYLATHSVFDDFVIAKLSQIGSRSLATDVLRGACNSAMLNSMISSDITLLLSTRQLARLISLGADLNSPGLIPAPKSELMAPFVRWSSTVASFIWTAMRSIYSTLQCNNAACQIPEAVMLMIARSDLNATTIMIIQLEPGGFQRQRQLHLLGQPPKLAPEGMVCVLVEVDIKFLISCLIKKMKDILDDSIINSAKFRDLSSKINNPLAIIRHIIFLEPGLMTLQCYQARSPRFSSGAVCDNLLACHGEIRDHKLAGKTAYEYIKDLARDKILFEQVEYESGILSLADGGKLGFMTMADAGIIPNRQHVIDMEATVGEYYPSTVERLKKLAA